ncbi:MAG: hypothetical protein ABL907_14735 [Hyphomicrobium sp.]
MNSHQTDHERFEAIEEKLAKVERNAKSVDRRIVHLVGFVAGAVAVHLYQLGSVFWAIAIFAFIIWIDTSNR